MHPQIYINFQSTFVGVFLLFFFSKKHLFKDEEFHCIANKGKTAKNEWANNDSDFV